MRFKCIYCGQRIVAREETVGKRGKCPKCSHVLRVPKTTKGRPAIGGVKADSLQDRMTSPAKSFTAPWPGESGYVWDDIIDEPPHIDFVYLYGEKAGWLIPTYDKLSLFLMAVTTTILFAVNSQMRSDIYVFAVTAYEWEPRLLGLLAVFLGGLCLCVYHVFTRRERTENQKRCMVFFAVMANAITGILTGLHFIKGSSGWLLILPIWNIANSVLLLLMLWLKIINETCISDRTTTPGRVIAGSSAILAVLAVCDFGFGLYWPVTFSICVIYATSFDRALQSIFPGRADSATVESP